MRKYIFLFFGITALNSNAQIKPIGLLSSNSHYFNYNNKPTVLITSGEHYGAVLNPDFDFVSYLKELKRNGLNMTRTMTGAYLEPVGAFNIEQNTLGPLASKFICPFARSNYANTPEKGNKFDLSIWDTAYFIRLKAFMLEAQKLGVIVELSLFCPFYEEGQWLLSPFNTINNINGVGNAKKDFVYTLDKSDGVLHFQEKMVKKLVQELKNFPNLMYEICNEPYFGGITLEWQERISQVIRDVEKSFTYQHLITQNIANGSALITHPNPLVSVYNFHYASPPTAVTINYSLNKVIGNNETGFKGQQDSTYRKEAWEIILAGGALFNNLDYSFTVSKGNGSFKYPAKQPGGGSQLYRNQLGYLKKFIESFQFEKMQPDTSFYLDGIPLSSKAYMLAEKGKQYAFYLMNANGASLVFDIPKGNYSIEWLNPVTGIFNAAIKIDHKGGKLKLKSPNTTEDIALRMKRI